MRLLFFVMLACLVSAQTLQAQSVESPKKKLHGTFYVLWGYHRDTYSRSTIHFEDHKTGNYDFTFHKAKAKDQPDWNDFFHTPPTVPQYVLRAGYFFNDKHDLGIEISWDHLKYVVRDNQVLHADGTVEGHRFDTDTLVTPNFVHLEHTNGNNYLMISLIKRYQWLSSKNGNHKLSGNLRFGAGALVPKTDSYVLGNHNDGPFRVSGWVVGGGAAVRYDFFRYMFIEPSIKESFANYNNVKLFEKGRAQHHFFSTQYILSIGFNIPASFRHG